MMLLMLQRNHSAKPRPYELKDGAVTDTQLFEIRRQYAYAYAYALPNLGRATVFTRGLYPDAVDVLSMC
jgi:hypothetical protein